jgi:hypothetical protein
MAYQTALDTPLRIAHLSSFDRGVLDTSITFLPLGTAINRVPLQCFQRRVVVMALGVSRQQGVLHQGNYRFPDTRGLHAFHAPCCRP